MTLTGKCAAINFYGGDGALLDEEEKKSVDFPAVSQTCLNAGSARRICEKPCFFFVFFLSRSPFFSSSPLLIKAPCPRRPSRDIIESGEKGKCCFNLICRRAAGPGTALNS